MTPSPVISRHGKQWVFTFDDARRENRLRGGDSTWGREFVVEVTQEGRVLGLPVLNPAEWMWLQACLTACGAAKG